MKIFNQSKRKIQYVINIKFEFFYLKFSNLNII